MIVLDEYCRQRNRAKIYEVESTENAGRDSRLKSVKNSVQLNSFL